MIKVICFCLIAFFVVLTFARGKLPPPQIKGEAIMQFKRFKSGVYYQVSNRSSVKIYCDVGNVFVMIKPKKSTNWIRYNTKKIPAMECTK